MSTLEPPHRETPVPPASDRAFGLMMAAAACVVALWPWIMDQGEMRHGAVGLSVLLALAASIVPGVLAPFNRVWGQIGQILNRIVTPVVMGILFFGVLTPIALLMRWTGRRPLHLEWQPEAPSYWVHREPPGPEPESMKQPF